MRPPINTALLDALLRQEDDEEVLPPTLRRPELAAALARTMNSYPDVLKRRGVHPKYKGA